MAYYCNPLNIGYKYQHIRKLRDGVLGENCVCREAADPSMILFKGRYYIFPSMTAGFLSSDDMVSWEYHPFLSEMPICDYAPDVREVGEYMYFSASRRDEPCSFFRTKDPLTQPFEEIPGTFPFWDPNLFPDDDGKLYFYWGCSDEEPIYGAEMDPETMQRKTDPVVLIDSHMERIGYERKGHDHTLPGRPYIEGVWMTKHEGRYYLQYAIPGTEFNIYCDGVYVSEAPLGPFKLARNNPFSYMPGGFMPGAGHGSTMEDPEGRLWHTASMRISCNHMFERRIGIWKAGFDKDGDLFCDQRYGTWPVNTDTPAYADPDWMLLSYGKKVTASSGTDPEAAVDENCQTWWKAGSGRPGEWILLDLGREYLVNAVQINFMDDGIEEEFVPGETAYSVAGDIRAIDRRPKKTCWKLEGSLDGNEFSVIEDKMNAETDLPHDCVIREGGIRIRFLKLTVGELPYNETPCISGLRVFGKSDGELPRQTEGVDALPDGALNMTVSWKEDDAVGHNILWGYKPDKLYHSYMVFGKNRQNIGALIEGEPVYIRVDAFNEAGITEGKVIQLKTGEQNEGS